ncbi:MAG: hypothetical protein NVS2B16_20050 [Chloroflexota bacterium]
MDSQPNRHDIDDTDYDATNGKRWYYRLYSASDGGWFWEPRVPTPAELSAPHSFGGVSWEPTIIPETEWPSPGLRGPYPKRGEAIRAAEGWFDPNAR